ncbi:tetratricopeptide repeat protein [Pseudosulfitobacter pseudonitzschiae]|uniref:tetratricopeptide repeat protein n=1 Tax=Pseudosulfitobacter pseudonitzschiae TaxID=1402135 RepID=UPI001AF5F32B|nr:tetratricopeptide repeat protein [Pseudosulfitobacter pseudonitzschiae]MBM1813968.1 tetratricopeptide repeat protein [Pseudosulfitobacter pseudonitzschiae]MBM1830961.1 tetratricopeptide repeat protein [Pseudosulfitobacter pseudonitzschiae]MBM1835828.1 tetratricopeptide repeat protein [Pseudosulfitobacter pseudonitzschiae]MBM1840674.1 tetratricopeptide repeat protein [Pseudosulfitobacter pseudonitzschiae]MBM1845338.1 tetratricopeptide repeat protein [Pseudosulfitobacter pseudonitzschiae]
MSDGKTTDRNTALKSHLVAARDLLVAPHRLDESDNPVRMGVVAALRSLGAHAQAIPLYDAVLATAPAFQPALIGRVDASVAAGDLQAALSHIAAALTLMPADPALLLKQATVLRRLGEMVQAQKVLRTLAADPATTQHQKIAVARGLMAVRDFEDADRLFGQVLAKHPKSENAWIGRVDVALALGDPPLAIARCELGLEQLVGNSALQQKLANALQRIGRTDDAIGILQTLLQRDPRSATVQFALAAAQRAAGRTDAAASLYTDILKRSPSHRGALTAQIEMALLAGDMDAGLAACDLALSRLAAQDPEILRRKGQILLQSGQPAEAFAILSGLRSEAPVASPVHLQAARAALDAGEVGQAEAIFNDILQSDPTNAQAILGLAELAEARGDLKSAMTLLEHHIQTAD